ncbi:Hook-related protein family [Phytophthora cactorum]|nr:Hook-related protein family [Phytophthora cactorum]
MRTGDAEASSLMRWLAFYAANAQEDCFSIVLRLLKLAFPAIFEEVKALNGWKAVIATLEGFYETNLAVEVQKLEGTLNNTFTALLELCETKETFIKDILTMEDVVQADLMAIIEKIMAQGVSVLNVEAVEEKSEDKQDKESPGIGSPLYLSRNAALERVKRENGVLKQENVHLARELEQATTNFREIELEKEKLIEMMQGLKEQVDADTLKKGRVMHAQYNERINSLQLELDSTKAELKEKKALAGRVPGLSDEVDLLRPLAEKMKKVDSTVAKYKAKIDELSGAKDMLRRLEVTNAELMEKNLALESDRAKAATWQRKLKESKEANTAMEFRITELETALAREREEFRMTRAELEAIQGALQESKAMNAQLQESAGHQLVIDAAESSNSAPTIAGGICELNPELMQKLTRLEYENAELKKQIDSETGARIDELVDEIDDLSRLKKSFEKRYFDTQQTLQSTQSEIKQTKEHFESIVAELRARSREFCERQLCLEEDVAAQTLEKQVVVAMRDRLAAELSESVEREHQLEQEISRRDCELSELQQVCEAFARQNNQLAEQCESLARAREDVEANLTRQVECTSMQVEDANAERMRFQEQKARELEQLTSKLQDDKLKYDADRKRLEAVRISTMKELGRYQEQYSVSNADWSAKEDELNSRLKELERKAQSLKSTIKSQLESNTRLVEKNKAMKADAVEKREIIARLESSTTRLESKVHLLEKERNHFITENTRKRSSVDGISSYSSQLTTQVNLLKAKNYYLPRIQQVEHDKQQVEHKRRELLLVNAKLIQEQKQLHVKNVSLIDRIHDLEESVNHWQLCDERRRKTEEQPRLSDSELPGAKGQSTGNEPHSSELPDNRSEAMSLASGKKNLHHSNNTTTTFKKRKLYKSPGKTKSTSVEGDSSVLLEAGSTCSIHHQSILRTSSKTATLALDHPQYNPDESTQEKDKPSECKQQ